MNTALKVVIVLLSLFVFSLAVILIAVLVASYRKDVCRKDTYIGKIRIPPGTNTQRLTLALSIASLILSTITFMIKTHG